MKAVTVLHCSYKLSFPPWGLFVMSIIFSTGVCFPCCVELLSSAEIFRSVAAYIAPFLSVRDTKHPVIPLQQSWIVHCVVVALFMCLCCLQGTRCQTVSQFEWRVGTFYSSFRMNRVLWYKQVRVLVFPRESRRLGATQPVNVAEICLILM